MRIVVFLHLFLFSYTVISAQKIINITNDDALIMVGDACKIMSSEDNETPSVEDIQSDIGFKQNTSESILMGGTDPDKIWIKLVVHNQTKENVFLESLYALLDTFSLYHVENGFLKPIQQTGQYFSYSSRSLDVNTLNLTLPPTDKPITYLVNAKVKWSANVRLRVGTYKGLIRDFQYNNLCNGIFIGTILFFILYSLFIYNRLRDVSYLIFALYLALVSGFVIRNTGYLFTFIFRETPYLNDYTLVFQGLSGVISTFFVSKFMNIKEKLPSFYKLLNIFYLFFASNIAITLLGFWDLSVYMGYLVSPMCVFVAAYIGIKLWDKKDTVIFYCLMSWAALAVGGAIFALDNTGLISYNLITAFSLHWGIALQALFISFAIASRFSMIKAASTHTNDIMIKTLEENKRLIEEKNKMLEEKMQGHTFALENAMSKVNESEMKLQEYAHQLEKSNRELTEFAHIASHDLKAPIRGIMSFAQLYERRNQAKFDDTDREYFNYIKNNASHSARLIEDLLNYSKIDKNLGDPTEVDLNKCVFVASMSLQNIIQEKNAEIIYENLPILRGHNSLLTHLFQNLIGNGIKYNKSPQPIIEIRAEQKGNTITYSVRDNGIGIPEQHQKEVFAMFRRLHGQAEYEGTGIGLSFCTRIVETYGGKLWLSSEVGVGTTFYFTLPKAPVLALVAMEVA
jgi:signal transduction histidine kinase